MHTYVSVQPRGPVTSLCSGPTRSLAVCSRLLSPAQPNSTQWLQPESSLLVMMWRRNAAPLFNSPPPPPNSMSLPAETSPLGSRGQCTATLGPVAKPGRQLVLGPVPMLQLIISFSWALISKFLAFGTGVNLKRFMCAKGDGYKPVKARDSNCA